MSSGFRTPPAHACYLDTSEGARKVRSPFFPRPGQAAGGRVTIHRLRADALQNASGVLVCQLGKAHPSVLLRHYLNGDSAIEAYWKSLAWPAQGLFIGEPLAAPYQDRSRGPSRGHPRTPVR